MNQKELYKPVNMKDIHDVLKKVAANLKQMRTKKDEIEKVLPDAPYHVQKALQAHLDNDLGVWINVAENKKRELQKIIKRYEEGETILRQEIMALTNVIRTY